MVSCYVVWYYYCPVAKVFISPLYNFRACVNYQKMLILFVLIMYCLVSSLVSINWHLQTHRDYCTISSIKIFQIFNSLVVIKSMELWVAVDMCHVYCYNIYCLECFKHGKLHFPSVHHHGIGYILTIHWSESYIYMYNVMISICIGCPNKSGKFIF